MEENIKDIDNKFRQVFEEAPDALLILQANGYIYDMNRAARSIFSFTQDDQPLYSSVYIKPGLPLAARKAMDRIDQYSFDATIDFHKLSAVIPGNGQKGAVALKIKMTPVNQRNGIKGPEADYLLELTPTNGLPDIYTPPPPAACPPDVSAYQDAAFVCDKGGFILQSNAAAAKLFKLPDEKLTGIVLYSLFDNAAAASLRDDIKSLYKGKELRDKNYELKSGDSSIPLEVAASLTSSGADFIISFRNISARRQLGDLLKERSWHLDALAKVVDGALLECDVKDNVFHPFTNANTKAIALTGLSRGDLLSMSLTDALTDREGKERKKVLVFLAGKAQQLNKDEVVSFEARLRFGERDVYAVVRITGYEIAGRRKAIIIIRDTSKERILESELDYKLKELDGIKDALPGLYLKVNKKGVIQEYKTADLRFNIAVFPNDFVGKKPDEYLNKATADAYRAAITEVMNTGATQHGSFHMRYGAEDRFYEASISPIKGEDNFIVMVNNVDRRRGLENKVRELYAISSNREAGFVKNMDDILAFGKQIFGADAGLILHFSGDRQENVLVNYATDNPYGFVKGLEASAETCYAAVRNRQIFASGDTEELKCDDNCLHVKKAITSIISAPLVVGGKVEGAITFLTVAPNKMYITDEEISFIGFVGDLMGMALELRSAKKAVDTGLSTLKKLVASLDTPAVITDTAFRIKNANNVMLNICGCYDVADIDGQNLFTRFASDEIKSREDFKSAYKISKGGVFDFDFDIVLSDSKTQNLLWHVVEVKDSKGYVRGFLFVSESVKDMPAIRNLIGGPMLHT